MLKISVIQLVPNVESILSGGLYRLIRFVEPQFAGLELNVVFVNLKQFLILINS